MWRAECKTWTGMTTSCVTKRRKGGRSVALAEEEEATLEGWTPRSTDLKMSTIYNRSATEAPAELFRKDLISAMKLPDSEPLSADEYWVINDQWKQEWEKGVQVPVNPDSLPGPSVTVVSQTVRPHHDFKLPKNKYIRITKDENFKSDEHHLSPIPSKAEKVCSYDLDNVDIAWLKIINGERANMGFHPIREEQLEKVIEELEIRSWDKVQTIVKSEEGLGIEFDENVICDVCRSPDSEEGNEMVFCDSCNICVHQACYGITTIPAGSWLCRTCALGQRPECVLCPNRGGAMKCTRSGQKWAHVSCALWIPEVSIGCVEKMEPITKISSIPQSRWALICVLCRERVGACIQCSVKTCKVAYHVTCAFKHGLEMRAIIEDENADDGVKLRSYCEKHSVTPKKERCGSASEDDECKRKKRKDMTSEEKNQARAAKLQEIEGEFEKHVSPSDVSKHHEVDAEGITAIYNYWVLKRRASYNKPLLAPRPDDVDFLSRQQEQADHEKMKMFVQLRQDLERVRNLCYMVSRREKLSRTLFRMREQTFHKQIAVLSEPSYNLSPVEITAIKESNHGPSIYDRIYSHPSAPELSTDFETVLARIAGISPNDKGKIDRNGMKKKSENQYKKMYINGGLERRRSMYASMSSGSETDIKRALALDSSSTEGSKSASIKGKRLCKKRSAPPRLNVDTSTEDESKPWNSPRSKGQGLLQMEKELEDKTGSDDSDDLVTFFQVKKDSRGVSNIYSDTDSDSSFKDSRNESSHPMRTKAAMKEFTALNQGKHKKSQIKSSKLFTRNEKPNPPDSSIEDDYYRDKENVNVTKKKKKDNSAPSDLIVPQRQAAKKASESLRHHGKSKNDILSEQEAIKTMTTSNDENKLKSKVTKIKSKEIAKEKNTRDARDDKLKSPNDIYEFDKDLCGDGQDIIAYVPQRQAARKATENIKSGLNKPVSTTNENEVEQKIDKMKISEVKSKKDKEDKLDSFKLKKEMEQEKNKKVIKPTELKTRKQSKSSVSSSSSSSSCSSSSGSSSSSSSSSSDSANDEEDEDKKVPKLPLDKKSLFDPIPTKDETKIRTTEKKQQPVKKFEIAAFLEKGKHSVHSSSTSSSSSDSDDSTNVPSKKNEIVSKNKPEITEAHRDDSILKVGLASKKLRKTPEKKLKTSDGRPELEFQQPPTERKESSRAQEKSGRKTKTERSNSSGSTETKQSYNSNKVPPSKDITDRNKQQQFKRDTTKGKEESLSKKEIPGRKRKPDDAEKPSPTHKLQRKSSPKPTDHFSNEEKIKQHSPTQGKKIDKKVDSPIKKNEESLGSTLEREIAERKAGRDHIGKSNSKKSLDRLFEKRDKLVRENERKEQNALLKNKNNAPSKSPEIQINRLPEKSRESFKEKVIKDENKNDKISDQTWSSFNSCNILNEVDITQSQKQKSPVSELVEPLIKKSSITDLISNHTKKSSFSEAVQIQNNKTPTKVLEEIQASHKKTVIEPILTHRTEIDDKYLNSSRSVFSPEPELSLAVDIKPVVDKKEEEGPSLNSLPPVLVKEDINDSLPVLSPTTPLAQPDLLFKHDSIPQLEKVENITMATELHSSDPERTEPKKVSSRTSSVSASNQQRSIFSPQPPSKDSAVAELFDFESDILAEDDDGFNAIDRHESEDRNAQLFSFSSCNELFFKIDSKEENARETLNLVEKLRLGFAKKTQPDGEGENADSKSSMHLEELDQLDSKTLDEVKLDQQPQSIPPSSTIDLIEPNIPDEIKQNASELEIEDAPKTLESDVDCTLNLMKPILDEATLRLGGDHHLLPPSTGEKQDLPSYDSNDHYQYQTYGVSLDVGKVPGREKLDRSNSAQADERWVPPSSIPPSVHSYDPVPSPYGNKWAESELMPSRHSSSSSASSTSSSSHREEIEPKPEDLVHQPIPNNPLIPDMLPFQGLQSTMGYNPSCALDNAPSFHFSDTAAFSVPFLPTPACTQLPPYPPGNAGLFQPNFSTPYPSQHTLVNKLPEETLHMPPPACSAAFTASSHNMAITAAMVAPISAMIQDPQSLAQLPFQPPENCQPQATPELLPPQTPDTFNHQPPASVSSEESPTPKSVGKKSPLKPTRTSARCIAQQTKSPAKSPGKSPRQLDTSRGKGKDPGGKRGRPPGRGVGHRGRGRGRGRGKGHTVHNDPNTITSKLVGTVYDFDFDEDEEGGDSLENLRAMRERRKSSDIHEKKTDSYLNKDSPHSPKLTSPLHHKGRTSYSCDNKSSSPENNSNKEEKNENTRPVDIVEPLLPGPVDMRTYSSYSAISNTTSSYQNHLLEPFTSAPPLEPTKRYVEELEEEIKTLSATTATKINDDTVSKVLGGDAPLVSVDDSRNQLKVKIKGPFLDANYSASSCVAQVRPTNPNITQTEGASVPLGPTSSITSSGGTSNLRRMRKKELLRQYWTQDMNMDDSATSVPPSVPMQDPLVNRTIITIPKAVASMTSIPTREDYKAFVDANLEKKRKKEKLVSPEPEEIIERRKSIGSNQGSDPPPQAQKRRGRTPKGGTAPKLKIKIRGDGNNQVSVSTLSEERKNLRVRPPKKRLTNMPKPTVEEMKRESMKYRKMVMAGFDEEDKLEDEQRSKKRKKRSLGDTPLVRVITDESAPKLIIRFAKRTEEEDVKPPSPPVTESEPRIKASSECSDRTSDDNPALKKVRTSKITPIRLKLSRCEEGYVMKVPISDNVGQTGNELSPTDVRETPPTLPLSKDCEVR